MESELDPVVSTSANAPAGASPGARFPVGLALVACWLTVLAPLSALAAVVVVVLLVIGVSGRGSRKGARPVARVTQGRRRSSRADSSIEGRLRGAARLPSTSSTRAATVGLAARASSSLNFG